MMFGSRQPFDYLRCDTCGTLQIAEFPADMAPHYSAGAYYSFNNAGGVSPLKRAVRRAVAGTMIGRPDRAPAGGGVLDRLKRSAEPWISAVPGLKRTASVLDVGCGEGARLEALAALGFGNLSGIDPFLPPERVGKTASGIELIRGELASAERLYDLITMHHSLEHVEDPGRLLTLARDRLNPGGRVLVRIPLLQLWAWDRYEANWAQLDAPRHFYLFTAGAFVALAGRAGLACTSHGYDGMGWSIAWSEGYARDIPMNNPDGTPNALPFSASEFTAFEAEARRHNAAGEGEAGWFVLEPAG
jgi:2-polyprenyl-3-methyl-5-hydroxy-6-metoxy-1,4-benzoquinol methylase